MLCCLTWVEISSLHICGSGRVFLTSIMAQQKIQQNKKLICCPICLDLLKDPVTIPCGHIFCMNCIKKHWDEEGQKETHSCPQCRQIFTSRPALVKNTILADLLEELEKTGLQAAPADHCFAGSGDVACDFCTGRKLKAVKSCLQCLVSYCELHLQPHYESPAFEKHKLIKPSQKLRENSLHHKVMEILCRTDQQCTCYLCSVDDQTPHGAVSPEANMAESQMTASQQKIQENENFLMMVQQYLDALNYSADKTVSDSEKVYSGLIKIIEKKRSDVKKQIRMEQCNKVIQVKEKQDKLEQELANLRRQESELKKLEEHIESMHV
ncbi:E3 ubiquitin/ISG15 ligase TRIM25-like [Parambassis ranga]|uniref:E3 ubiquitin/ISG15 ligase TRIM25-like n=1 Tax=Parambassis ranga TaxID=210632 RepID=A0A6P7JCD2_9TELE|nr:E3 ubiquitin/ISG15 ligase TRIM25-like [Parambassis ranga]